ncbi:MAG TPA: peptidase M50 [Candidatus Nanoarchaeia archaeon]|nr:peptidase M50 [Candidatus Nanoarchaeia archaeon]
MLKFSIIEKHCLLKAWLVISIAFGLVINPHGWTSPKLLLYVLIAGITVGSGFLLHELCHKLVAQRYHCWAEFRSDDKMLFFALITSLFGVVFAAPGAVIIQGHVSPKQNGLISAAGPVANLVLALVFLALSPWLGIVAYYGYLINAWLALFNLIPVWLLDGKKVLHWNKPIYFALLFLAAVFYGASFVLFK